VPDPPKRLGLDSDKTHQPPRQQLPGRSQLTADTLVGFGACIHNRCAFRVEACARQPGSASTSARCDSSTLFDPTEVASPRAEPVYPLPPALTPGKITRGFRRSGTPTIHTEVHPVHANARASPNLGDRPRGDHGPLSAARRRRRRTNPPRVVGAAAPPLGSQAGKPARSPAAQTKPKQRSHHRFSFDDCPRAALCERANEGVALNRPGTPKGLVRTRDSHGRSKERLGGRRSTPKRWSAPASALTEVTAEPAPSVNCRSSRPRGAHMSHPAVDLRRHRPARPDGSFKEPRRTCSHDCRAAAQSWTNHLPEGRRLAPRATSDRGRAKLTATASDPSRGSIPTERSNRPDIQRAACLLRRPKAR
jgi:hypothetical protein